MRLPPTYTEKDEYGCVRTFSSLLCPEALATTKELEEHVVGNEFLSGELGTPFLVDLLEHVRLLSFKSCINKELKCLVNGSAILDLQVSFGHWRRLGKLFVHGQLRQTFLPEAADDTQVLMLFWIR